MTMHDAQMRLLYQHEYHPLGIGSDPKGKDNQRRFLETTFNHFNLFA